MGISLTESCKSRDMKWEDEPELLKSLNPAEFLSANARTFLAVFKPNSEP